VERGLLVLHILSVPRFCVSLLLGLMDNLAQMLLLFQLKLELVHFALLEGLDLPIEQSLMLLLRVVYLGLDLLLS
jgi:hypothetical protein